MSDLNFVTIMGRLTRDPELRRGQSGVPFSTFTIAANRRWKDDAGNQREETAFVPVIVFGKPAEWAVEHIKGETVVLTGRLRTESWEADGSTQTRLVLVVGDVQQFVEPVFGARGAARAKGMDAHTSVATETQMKIPF